MSAPVLQVVDVRKHYTQRTALSSDASSAGSAVKRRLVKAVDGVSFTLDRGEILGIIGESGCGKSTLGRLLIHLEEPTSGKIILNGTDVRRIRENRKAARIAFRGSVQLIFQNPYEVFDPRERIEKVLTTTLRLHGIGGNEAEQHLKCVETLEAAGFFPAEDYLQRYPHELSGGQLQRIAIMRSMLTNPAFVVADEAVSMLDVSIRADILALLEKQVQSNGACMVFISHDIATTRYISDRVAVMYLGRIVEYGPTDAVLHSPVHPYTRALISNSASLDPTEKKEIIPIEGEPPTPIGTGPGCYFAPRCYRCQERCGSEYPEMLQAGPGHFYSCLYADTTE